jgi:hypothetical protein
MADATQVCGIHQAIYMQKAVLWSMRRSLWRCSVMPVIHGKARASNMVPDGAGAAAGWGGRGSTPSCVSKQIGCVFIGSRPEGEWVRVC